MLILLAGVAGAQVGLAPDEAGSFYLVFSSSRLSSNFRKGGDYYRPRTSNVVKITLGLLRYIVELSGIGRLARDFV